MFRHVCTGLPNPVQVVKIPDVTPVVPVTVTQRLGRLSPAWVLRPPRTRRLGPAATPARTRPGSGSRSVGSDSVGRGLAAPSHWHWHASVTVLRVSTMHWHSRCFGFRLGVISRAESVTLQLTHWHDATLAWAADRRRAGPGTRPIGRKAKPEGQGPAAPARESLVRG